MRLPFTSSLRRHLLRGATALYGGLRGRSQTRSGYRILTYHAFGTPLAGDVRSLYSMPPARFAEHMKHLAEHHRGELIPFGPAKTGRGLGIAVTFDDGYEDNLRVAAPLLSSLGIPFTVFASTGAVRSRKQGFLTPEQLRELSRAPGVKIGSHSIDHPRLTECGDARLKEELAGSKAYLEDLLGEEIDSLSYPHGAVNRRVRDMAASVGYVLGACSRFDINPMGRDPLLLCRTDIWADDDVPVFEAKLRGDWDWNRWRAADPAGSAHDGGRN